MMDVNFPVQAHGKASKKTWGFWSLVELLRFEINEMGLATQFQEWLATLPVKFPNKHIMQLSLRMINLGKSGKGLSCVTIINYTIWGFHRHHVFFKMQYFSTTRNQTHIMQGADSKYQTDKFK